MGRGIFLEFVLLPQLFRGGALRVFSRKGLEAVGGGVCFALLFLFLKVHPLSLLRMGLFVKVFLVLMRSVFIVFFFPGPRLSADDVFPPVVFPGGLDCSCSVFPVLFSDPVSSFVFGDGKAAGDDASAPFFDSSSFCSSSSPSSTCSMGEVFPFLLKGKGGQGLAVLDSSDQQRINPSTSPHTTPHTTQHLATLTPTISPHFSIHVSPPALLDDAASDDGKVVPPPAHAHHTPRSMFLYTSH